VVSSIQISGSLFVILEHTCVSGGGMPKTIVLSLSLSHGTAHAMSECQTKVRENAVSKYHFSKDKYCFTSLYIK